MRCIELVAGSVAELVCLGESEGLRGSDREKAHMNASFLAESKNAVQLIIRAAELEAEHQLRAHEAALHALASALLEQRRMTGEAVLALIERNVKSYSPPSVAEFPCRSRWSESAAAGGMNGPLAARREFYAPVIRPKTDLPVALVSLMVARQRVKL